MLCGCGDSLILCWSRGVCCSRLVPGGQVFSRVVLRGVAMILWSVGGGRKVD